MSSEDEIQMDDSDSDQGDLDDECLSDDDGIALESHDQNNSEYRENAVPDNEVLNHDSLEIEMKKTIADVQAVLQTKGGMCRILLHKYKWNKESLLERFYENPDTTTFLIDAQVIPRHTESVPAGDSECDICCIVGPLSGLACNHRACTACWKSYLTNKIVDAGQSEIECMAANCKLLIEDEKVMTYITDPNVIASYRRLIVASYVETNRLLKWCPGVDCGKAVKVSHCEPRLVVCSCGSRFCFSCSNDWHEPVNCRLLKLWMKKCSDDSETSNWINANTKECPKCMITIEKDGGCNHMTCKNTACRFEFCWMCLGPWEPHGSSWYNCNRFDDSVAKTARDAQEVSRANLQRYLFYYNRYMGHQQSLRLEGKLYATVKSKMEQMQTLSMSWIEVQFLRKAVDVLSECRRTLMFTYAFAFYLQRDNNSIIFETNQKDLEMETEQLSGFLERDLDSENLVTLKQKVQDKYRYVEHRRKILLDHCAEGAEQDIWMFNE
ncbi:Protein CBR-ARI-1 [Caenorhabditis briggsae]|uniref:RBR-type E3 ubiquitin transferase n=2 Tax=Caenorhabditis briggsae TaxID=6238 RepID=A0AAE9J0K5_CAEBR|nr:Protein CBR-ARI-1 [Caenorhabditis briggsae]ULU13268.1 hypothetical protein L3Y34_016047 [Caenorhabditis briggsae]CAP37335.1 Protein CBR-ARI-1 [Caenorhabditis briggsae]